MLGLGKAPEIGGKYCGVVVGSMVDTGSSGLRKVVSVQIADVIPRDQIARVMTSGRAWLKGGTEDVSAY